MLLCGVLLRRSYDARTKVCAAHVAAEEVEVASVVGPARFCQRCHLFHSLTAFAGAQHSCLHSLKLCKARREAKKETTPLPDATEWLSAIAGITSPADCPILSSFSGEAAMLGADVATQLVPVTCRIKLPEAEDPRALPPATTLRTGLTRGMSPAAPFTVGIAPGCVLLSVDAHCEAVAEDGSRMRPPLAQRLASALQDTGFAAHQAAVGGYVLAGGTRIPLQARAMAWGPSAPLVLPLPPRAVPLDGAGEWVEVACALTGTPDLAWAARICGQALAVQAGEGVLRLRRRQLRALGGQGCVLLTVVPASGAADMEPLRSEPRALLVCASAALAAQLDVALQTCGGADGAAQRVIRIIGDALRPRAALRMRVAAAAISAWLGSDLLITALLALAAESESSAADGAMVLALEVHGHAKLAACAGQFAAAAVASATSALVSPSAWQVANDLLFEATSNGHARPEAAARAALDRAAALGDPGVARVQKEELEPLELALAATSDEAAASILFCRPKCPDKQCTG